MIQMSILIMNSVFNGRSGVEGSWGLRSRNWPIASLHSRPGGACLVN